MKSSSATQDVYSAEATAERITLSIDKGSARAQRFSSREQRKTGGGGRERLSRDVKRITNLSIDNESRTPTGARRISSSSSGEQRKTGQARLVGRSGVTKKVASKSSQKKKTSKTKKMKKKEKKTKFVMQTKIKAWSRKERLSKAVDWEEQQHNCYFLDYIKSNESDDSSSEGSSSRKFVRFSKTLGIHIISDQLTAQVDVNSRPANRFRQELNAMKRYSTDIFHHVKKNELPPMVESSSSHLDEPPSSLRGVWNTTSAGKIDTRMQINAL